MKRSAQNLKFRTSIFLFASVLFFTVSCEDDSSRYSDLDQLSSFAKDYLQMMSSPGLNAAYNQASNPVNGSFQRLLSSAGRLAGRTNDSTGTDTTLITPGWTTCATTSVINNPDKSVTTIVDYGDGCEEGSEYYKYFIHGKYTYTYRSHINESTPVRTEDFEYTFSSDNYGGRYYYQNDTTYWTSNGTSGYAGSSSFNQATNAYSGSFTYHADNEYTYGGITYSYTGASKSSYNEKRHITEESSYTSRYGQNYYHSLVLEPLVIRYDCNPWESLLKKGSSTAIVACYWLPMYVSGREFIKYKKDGREGSFTIDWGDGLCDSKIVIEENGNYYKVDWANAQAIFGN